MFTSEVDEDSRISLSTLLRMKSTVPEVYGTFLLEDTQKNYVEVSVMFIGSKVMNRMFWSGTRAEYEQTWEIVVTMGAA